MVVSTHTPALENERRMLLKMLAQDHPAAGLTQAPEKPFYRYARQYGLTEKDFNGSHQPQLDDPIPIFKSTCRSALFVIAVCGSAKKCRASLFGRCSIEDTKHELFLTRGPRCAKVPALAVGPV